VLHTLSQRLPSYKLFNKPMADDNVALRPERPVGAREPVFTCPHCGEVSRTPTILTMHIKAKVRAARARAYTGARARVLTAPRPVQHPDKAPPAGRGAGSPTASPGPAAVAPITVAAAAAAVPMGGPLRFGQNSGNKDDEEEDEEGGVPGPAVRSSTVAFDHTGTGTGSGSGAPRKAFNPAAPAFTLAHRGTRAAAAKDDDTDEEHGRGTAGAPAAAQRAAGMSMHACVRACVCAQ
jgi:hypothetical protein